MPDLTSLQKSAQNFVNYEICPMIMMPSKHLQYLTNCKSSDFRSTIVYYFTGKSLLQVY